MSELASAPETPFAEDGSVRWGTYRGSCDSTDLTEASERLGEDSGGRFFREKHWQWFAAANSQIACGGTLFDAGYATTVFLWVFDRNAERMVVDKTELLPPFSIDIRDNPGSGGGAYLRGLRRQFDIERGSDGVTVEVSLGAVELELQFETRSVDAVTAICPVGERDDPGVNVTQKQCCVPVEGRIAAGGRVFELGANGVGMLDYTHGLFERETSWRWAIACGVLEDDAPVGVNFAHDFNDNLENVVWLGDELRAVGAVEIDFDGRRPSEPWTVRSEDGSIDLSMIVEGVREHETNFQLVSSSYLQPVGRLHGRVIDREVHDLFAVAEAHRTRW